MSRRDGQSGLAATLAMGLLCACATNPVTGRPQLVFMSEAQEIALGRESDPQISASMGLYDDEALQRYVEEIGLRMARASERPGLPWQFRVVDDPAVNAFALPGGYIYVTRGILAHMASEAELAGVLGHEIGHVTARHAVSQYTKQMGAQLVLLPTAVLLPAELQGLGLLGPGFQLLFLKYGRDDERQSDQLGLGYMVNSGYDPTELVNLFQTLGRTSRATDGARVPEWLATHPAPENREQLVRARIASLPTHAGTATFGREPFLRRIDGIVYGDDPREGFSSGANVFHHPGLAFRLSFPKGWKTLNQRHVVGAVSPERDAVVQLGLAEGKSAEAAARAFLGSQGIESTPPKPTRIGGLDAFTADFAAAGSQNTIRGIAVFLKHGEYVYGLLGYAAQDAFVERQPALNAALTSFARETERAVLEVQPWRVQVVTPKRRLSQAAFAKEYPGPVSADELAILNQLDAGEFYPAGVSAKRVVGRKLPE